MDMVVSDSLVMETLKIGHFYELQISQRDLFVVLRREGVSNRLTALEGTTEDERAGNEVPGVPRGYSVACAPKGIVFSCFGHKLGIDFGHFGRNRVWFLHSGLFFGRSYFFIIIDKTINIK